MSDPITPEEDFPLDPWEEPHFTPTTPTSSPPEPEPEPEALEAVIYRTHDGVQALQSLLKEDEAPEGGESPIETIIDLLERTVAGISGILTRLDAIEEKLAAKK